MFFVVPGSNHSQSGDDVSCDIVQLVSPSYKPILILWPQNDVALFHLGMLKLFALSSLPACTTLQTSPITSPGSQICGSSHLLACGSAASSTAYIRKHLLAVMLEVFCLMVYSGYHDRLLPSLYSLSHQRSAIRILTTAPDLFFQKNHNKVLAASKLVSSDASLFEHLHAAFEQICAYCISQVLALKEVP